MRVKRKHILPVLLATVTAASLTAVFTGAVFAGTENTGSNSFVNGAPAPAR